MALSDVENLVLAKLAAHSSRLPVAKEVSMLRRSTARSARLTCVFWSTCCFRCSARNCFYTRTPTNTISTESSST